MPRFFVKEENFTGENRITLFDEDAVHISRSLRMKIGDRITVCDFHNYEYLCEIESISSDDVVLEVHSRRVSDKEPSQEVFLFQCMPKGDKLELIIQKCTELGICGIYLVDSEYCISRPDAKSAQKKLLRYEKIALEAAKQSGRAKIPFVSGIISFKEALSKMKESSLSFVCYENETDICLKDVISKRDKDCRSIAFLVGPEGGISNAEAQIIKAENITTVGLGKRILRTETAPICVLSAIMYETDNLK